MFLLHNLQLTCRTLGKPLVSQAKFHAPKVPYINTRFYKAKRDMTAGQTACSSTARLGSLGNATGEF